MSNRKWNWLWAGAIILVLLCFGSITWMIYLEPCVPDSLQVSSQALGAFTGIYVSFVIFLQSKAESDRLNREMLEQFKMDNDHQINAIHESAKAKVEAIHLMRTEMVQVLKELKLTTEGLKTEVKGDGIDCTVLRREKRELIEKIETLESEIGLAEQTLDALKEWKFLRTPAEREDQLKVQRNTIDKLIKKREYLSADLRQVQQKLKNCTD